VLFRSNACTADSCDPVNGCQHAAVNCDDANACTADSCNPQTGCTHAAVNCDDGDICTNDSCSPASGCVHQPIANCAPRPNDLCANAIDLGAGSVTVTGSTLGAHNEVDPPAACVASGGANGGADVFYKLTIAQTEWVTFDTFGSPIDTVLYLLDGCGGNVLLAGSACNDDSGCGAPNTQRSAIALRLAPGTYIVVVDSFGPAAAGAFTLHVSHSGPSCASATAITLGTSVVSTTVGGTRLVTPSQCGSTAGSGPERMFLFFMCPANTFNVEARTCGSGALDSVVYLRHNTCTGIDLSCDDDGCGFFAGPSDMVANGVATGGGLYFIIVDTFLGALPGPFTLTTRRF